MKTRAALVFIPAIAFAIALPVLGSMVAPLSTEESLRIAEAACRGTVLGTESYENVADGGIYTRVRVRVDEIFKGRFPAEVIVVQRGGRVGRKGETEGCSLQLRTGDTRTLFLERRSDRSLVALHGAAGSFGSEDQTLGELRARTAHERGGGDDVTDQAWVSQASPMIFARGSKLR